jgi:predicted secreted protein
MAAINGTVVLLYSGGQPIAMQKGLSIGLDVDLSDATNKESAGWAEHLTGLMNAKIDFNALFSTGLMSDTPAVLSAKDLMDYILNQTNLLVSILGGAFPIIGEADLSSLSFDAPLEGAMTLSGSLKINGALYPLTGTMAQMITDPDEGGTSSEYDIHTVSGTAFTSLVNSAGDAAAESNVISVADTGIYKFVTYLTVNSGQVPTVGIWDNTSAYISNTQALVAGLNFITLTATSTDASASLRISNTEACDLVTTPIYLFKVG